MLTPMLISFLDRMRMGEMEGTARCDVHTSRGNKKEGEALVLRDRMCVTSFHDRREGRLKNKLYFNRGHGTCGRLSR